MLLPFILELFHEESTVLLSLKLRLVAVIYEDLLLVVLSCFFARVIAVDFDLD